MPVEYKKSDNIQTRIYQSFVNLTAEDSTTYPALTTTRIDNTNWVDPLTSYTIYDQYAVRIVS